MVKNPPANTGDARDAVLVPGMRKIPWRREWLPTPVFSAGESHAQRSLVGFSPWGFKKSDTTEQLGTERIRWTPDFQWFSSKGSPSAKLSSSDSAEIYETVMGGHVFTEWTSHNVLPLFLLLLLLFIPMISHSLCEVYCCHCSIMSCSRILLPFPICLLSWTR